MQSGDSPWKNQEKTPEISWFFRATGELHVDFLRLIRLHRDDHDWLKYCTVRKCYRVLSSDLSNSIYKTGYIKFYVFFICCGGALQGKKDKWDECSFGKIEVPMIITESHLAKKDQRNYSAVNIVHLHIYLRHYSQNSKFILQLTKYSQF